MHIRARVASMREKARQDRVEIYMVGELINEAVSSVNREEASNYITKEVLPSVKAAFTPEKYQEMKKYAEEKLGVKPPDRPSRTHSKRRNELKRGPIEAIAKGFKLWLARRGLMVIAEMIDHEKSLCRVCCPKCRTWHVAYLSGYPEDEHFHLPCGETVFYISNSNPIIQG